MQSKPLIIAHRGASDYLPENTLESIELGIRQKADMTEFDVHLSQDGVPVVIHDVTLQRTTNGNGYVADVPYAAIRNLDAGFHFIQSGESFPAHRGKGLRIPTLESLLVKFSNHPLSVEIKIRSTKLTDQVVALLKQHHNPELCIVGSKHAAVGNRIKSQYPYLQRFLSEKEIVALVMHYKSKGLTPVASDWSRCVASIPTQCHGINLASKDWISFLHEKGIKVFYWTINDGATALKLASFQADGIITNDPLKIRSAIFNGV